MDAPGDAAHRLFDESGVIRADAPCRRCGYNLRGLREDGRCPECGTPIGLSTHGDLLRFADPAWVEKLTLGIKYIIWGLVVAIVIGGLGGCLSGVTGTPALAQVIGTVAGLLGFYGAWLLTSPDPSGIGDEQYVTARKLIRFALLCGLAGQLVQIPVSVLPAVSQAAATVCAVVGGLAGLAGMVGEIAKYRYLATLADRVPEVGLAGQARFLSWALGITTGLGAIAGVLIAVFATGAGPAAFLGGPAGPGAPTVTPAASAPATQPATQAAGNRPGLASAPYASSAPGAARSGAPGATTAGTGPPPFPPGGRVSGGLIAGGIAVCFVGLAWLVFAVMALVLQVRLGRRFREQAEIARTTWAAALTDE